MSLQLLLPAWLSLSKEDIRVETGEVRSVSRVAALPLRLEEPSLSHPCGDLSHTAAPCVTSLPLSFLLTEAPALADGDVLGTTPTTSWAPPVSVLLAATEAEPGVGVDAGSVPAPSSALDVLPLLPLLLLPLSLEGGL